MYKTIQQQNYFSVCLPKMSLTILLADTFTVNKKRIHIIHLLGCLFFNFLKALTEFWCLFLLLAINIFVGNVTVEQ